VNIVREKETGKALEVKEIFAMLVTGQD